MEFGVGEAENDGENGSRDVTQQEGQKCRNLPVLALSDDDVQIAAELVSL